MNKKRKKRWVVFGSILFFLIAIPAAVYGIFHSYYGKMNIQPIKEGSAGKTGGLDAVDRAFAGTDVCPGDGQNVGTDVCLDDGQSADQNTDAEDLSEGEVRNYENYLRRNIESRAKELPYDSENVYNILVIGTDTREPDQGGRSDAMMIVSINRETKKIIMTSVMRDIYCTIPGVGNTRINHAYTYGGASLLLETIEYNFGIHLEDYVMIDFFGFMDTVDAIGGVELSVSADEIRVMNGYIRELNSLLGLDKSVDLLDADGAGILHLNGKQALAYSRVRYVGNSDFERTNRQRVMMATIMKKAKKLSLSELNDLMNAVLPCVTTSLTQREVLSLLLHAGEYLDYELVSGRIPTDGTWNSMKVRGMSVLGIDFAENVEYWRELVYGEQAHGIQDGNGKKGK